MAPCGHCSTQTSEAYLLLTSEAYLLPTVLRRAFVRERARAADGE